MLVNKITIDNVEESMSYKSVSLFVVICLCLLGCNNSSTSNLDSAINHTDSNISGELNLFVATDLHYLSPSLHDNGEAFHTYIKSGDSKLLHYSEQLLDAWITQVIHAQPEAVIISGDLTNNGEKLSHHELAKKLRQIEAAGSEVYVIPGNHDILNPWARSFKNDKQYITDHITEKEFASIYKNFGYDKALSIDKHSLSYVAQVSNELWLLMLDTSKYDHNMRLGYPQTDGELSKETLSWVKENGELAQKNNAKIITVMHHNLIDHSDFSNMGFTLNNDDQLFDILHQQSISLTLSGHLHIQDIRSKKGVYDIATSAFVVYPYHFGVIHFTPELASFSYHTEKIDVDGWSRLIGSSNPDLLQFNDYGQNFFITHSYDKAFKSLEGQGYSDEERNSMAEAMSAINLYYFAGRGEEISQELFESSGVNLWRNATSQFIKDYVLSMLRSSGNHNSLRFSLKHNEE